MEQDLYAKIKEKLAAITTNGLTTEDKKSLETILHLIEEHKQKCIEKGISEHFKWCFKVIVNKFFSMESMLAGEPPYETIERTQNIVLDNGRAEIMKLLTGTGGKPFNQANAKIFVGDSSKAESASHTGIQATTNKASTNMVSGYPQVTAGSAKFKGILDNDVANFDIREMCVANGTASSDISLNRRVVDLGRKAAGTTWEVIATISLLPN